MHGIMQKVELKASKVVHVGTCDNSAGNYALAKKKMTMEVRASLMQYTKTALSQGPTQGLAGIHWGSMCCIGKEMKQSCIELGQSAPVLMAMRLSMVQAVSMGSRLKCSGHPLCTAIAGVSYFSAGVSR